MRLRFSLRTLLIATAILALFLFYWVIRPTQTANQFVRAVNCEDYTTADQLTWHSSDLSFSKWKDERWGFSTKAELAPWSIRQFLRGNRDIELYMTYFQLDETHETRMHLAATSLGIKQPDTITKKHNAVIDTSERASRIIDKR
jgi:hypothetical protein